MVWAFAAAAAFAVVIVVVKLCTNILHKFVAYLFYLFVAFYLGA